MKLHYREDIDGLRAIAVLLVILNHAGIGLFSGGFIGVDVFFVISGYLITAIIINDIDEKKFSLIRFYERRIRRIFPVLFAVMIFTMAVCYIIYDPEKLKAVGKSVIATTFFASNINFWKESGYFDISSQLKPLLHTWSLAVEEQFYILFPLFMVILTRFSRKHLTFVLSVAAVTSFGFCIYITLKNPTEAFYLAHLRAWELLMGAILSTHNGIKYREKEYTSWLGYAGIAMVAIPAFRYTENTQFPGFTAAIPVLGATLIIYSGIRGETSIRRFLSLPLLTFIGKISYSLYLWHWPVIIFVNYYVIRPLTNAEIVLEITIIFILSLFSWHYIETPFRSKSFLQTKQVFIFAAGAMTLPLALGIIIYSNQGFPDRDMIKLETDKKIGNERWNFEKCDVNYGDHPKALTICDLGSKSQAPSFLIWGDSHAPTLGKAIHMSAAAADMAGVLTYNPGCPSLLDMLSYPLRGNIPCPDYNNLVIEYLNKHPEITTVILVNRWSVWAEGTSYNHEGNITYKLIDLNTELPNSTTDEADLFKLGLERTIQTLIAMHRKIVIVAPLPEIGYDVPSANFVALQTGRDLNEIIAPTIDEYQTRNKKTFKILNYFEKEYDVQIVELWRILCPETHCRVTIEGLPLYKDDDHLSVFGSEIIAPAFDPIFNSMP